MLTIALALALGLSGSAGAAAPIPDEQTKIKIAEYMIKVRPDEADPKLVAGFMDIDVQTLPKRLREKAKAKQIQIDAIVRIHKGRRKGSTRIVPASCQPKRYYGDEGLRVMRLVGGGEEIAPEEEDYIERKTNCSEDQLICEFSLNVVVYPREGKPPMKRYFLMSADPLMALVAEQRAGFGPSKQPRYFQEALPTCKSFR